MKKIVLILTVIFLLATPGLAFAANGGTIHFNEPTFVPRNLDELYMAIENGAPGWNSFTDCAQKGLTKPFFRWSMVKQIVAYSADDHGQALLIIPAADLARIVAPGGIVFPTPGTLKVSENTLFSSLFKQAMDGKVLLCQQDKDLIMFGPGAQALFDALLRYSN